MTSKKFKQKILAVSLALTFTSAPMMVNAQPSHSGGTDKNGCHVCRTNCRKYGMPTGYYHRHNPVRPCR